MTQELIAFFRNSDWFQEATGGSMEPQPARYWMSKPTVNHQRFLSLKAAGLVILESPSEELLELKHTSFKIYQVLNLFDVSTLDDVRELIKSRRLHPENPTCRGYGRVTHKKLCLALGMENYVDARFKPSRPIPKHLTAKYDRLKSASDALSSALEDALKVCDKDRDLSDEEIQGCHEGCQKARAALRKGQKALAEYQRLFPEGNKL